MKAKHFSIMGLIVFGICFVVMSVGALFFGVITERATALLGAFIFFLLAYIAASPEKDAENFKGNTVSSVAILGGAAVALDASLAAFNLSLEGFDALPYSLLFGLVHLLFAFLGYRLSKSPFFDKLQKKLPSIAAVLLCILGILRLI